MYLSNFNHLTHLVTKSKSIWHFLQTTIVLYSVVYYTRTFLPINHSFSYFRILTKYPCLHNIHNIQHTVTQNQQSPGYGQMDISQSRKLPWNLQAFAGDTSFDLLYSQAQLWSSRWPRLGLWLWGLKLSLNVAIHYIISWSKIYWPGS